MKQQYLEAGEIVGTHGIRGEVKILPWADGPEFLTGFDVLYLVGTACEVEAARFLQPDAAFRYNIFMKR